MNNTPMTAQKWATMSKQDRWRYKSKLHDERLRLKEEAVRIEKIEFEASMDYDKLIREAKKRFNDLDIAILSVLNNSEYYSSYSHIQGLIYDNSRIDEKIPAIRLRTRRLIRLGLVEYRRGLFTEDGEVAGSGFAQSHRYSIIRRIIQSYMAGNNNLELDLFDDEA